METLSRCCQKIYLKFFRSDRKQIWFAKTDNKNFEFGCRTLEVTVKLYSFEATAKVEFYLKLDSQLTATLKAIKNLLQNE